MLKGNGKASHLKPFFKYRFKRFMLRSLVLIFGKTNTIRET